MQPFALDSPASLDVFTLWLLFGSLLGLLCQCGFVMLEAGTTRGTNAKAVFFKALLQLALGVIVWWAMGYPFAYGSSKSTDNSFIGLMGFFQTSGSYFQGATSALWLQQCTLAALVVAIVSGGVCERCQLVGHLLYTAAVTGIIYPVVAHWAWSNQGFLAPNRVNSPLFPTTNGLVDVGGSGVVHVTAGAAGLMGAYFIGSRYGRSCRTDGSLHVNSPSSSLLAGQGAALVWCSWVCLVPVNTLQALPLGGSSLPAPGKAAANLALAGAAALLSWMALHQFTQRRATVNDALFSLLGGLVACSGGCTVVEEYAAVAIGVVAAGVQAGGGRLVEMARIDDPMQCGAVHLGCGLWGLLSVGLLASPAGVAASGLSSQASGCGLLYKGSPLQLGVQLLGALCMAAWSGSLSCLLFYLLKHCGMLRISQDSDLCGADLGFLTSNSTNWLHLSGHPSAAILNAAKRSAHPLDRPPLPRNPSASTVDDDTSGDGDPNPEPPQPPPSPSHPGAHPHVPSRLSVSFSGAPEYAGASVSSQYVGGSVHSQYGGGSVHGQYAGGSVQSQFAIQLSGSSARAQRHPF